MFSFSIFRPQDDSILSRLGALRSHAYSYGPPGCTRTGQIPSGFNVDHTHAVLGRGPAIFENAKRALNSLTMLNLGWTWGLGEKPALQQDGMIALVAKVNGIYFTNMSRIVYVIDENMPSVQRIGFAYGTLNDHVEKGEERFLVEFDLESGDVSYDIYAVSKPHKFYVWCGYPYSRLLQKRFARESVAAMKKAVQ